MFWKNREKIKALEKEVEELRADNDKIHRILKHVGKEPCVEIQSKTTYDDSNAAGGYIWEYCKRIYTLYFYKDNSEYSVHLKEFDNEHIKVTNCEVKVVTNTFAILKVTVRKSWDRWIRHYNTPLCNDRINTYLINFNYVCGDYAIMQTFEDDENLYREIFCKNCDKNSDGE